MAVGTVADMKIRQLEADDDEEEAPPKKAARVEKASKGRKWLGREQKQATILAKQEGTEEREHYLCGS